MEKPKILVVDDEEALRQVLKFNLEVEGFAVDCAASAEEALQLNLAGYSLLLLDIMMGEMDGFALAQRLKQQPETAEIPIIFCTAKDTENDIVVGLTLGADDYIAKPFSVRELVARVKTVLRRAASLQGAATPTNDILCVETLKVDKNKIVCEVDNVLVDLTKKEFEVLVLLMEHAGTIYSRDEILHRVWDSDVLVVERTVDVTITRLRKKIGKYGAYIVTRHGYGYGFEV